MKYFVAIITIDDSENEHTEIHEFNNRNDMIRYIAEVKETPYLEFVCCWTEVRHSELSEVIGNIIGARK